MKKKSTIIFVITLLAIPLLAFALNTDPAKPVIPQDSRAQKSAPNFGGPKDVAFAIKLWRTIKGYKDWKLTSPVYKGGSPHGKWIRLYSTYVTMDDKHYPIIIKDNYSGRGVTKEAVDEDPAKWLAAVTIMLQREDGYDKDNANWFWAKYNPDGTLAKNPKGMQLAGRVAKGMPKGCISCHSNAGKGDYLFSND